MKSSEVPKKWRGKKIDKTTQSFGGWRLGKVEQMKDQGLRVRLPGSNK